MNLLSLWPRRRVPMILQSEAAECGLACLAMIASAHGHDTDLLTLRRRFEMSSRGATLGRLMQIADQMGLANRALRLELEELPQLQVPCILHWDLNHFVVLVRADAKRITVLDPAVGERTLTLKEASPHFTGVALELAPTQGFEKKTEKTPFDLRVLFAGQQGLWRAFAQMAVLSIVLETFSILMPMLSQWVIDDVVVTRDTPLLTVLCIAMFLLAFMALCTRLLRGWIVLGASLSWKISSSTNVFRYLLKLPLSYFDKRHTGDVMSRFASVGHIQDTITTNLIETVLDQARRIRPAVVPALAVLVLALAWTAVSHLVGEVSYAEVAAALAATPDRALAIALGCTLLSFVALMVYDLGALDFIDRKVPRNVVALTSFCAYSVGNTVGFGPLTAGAIRYRFYTPYGLEPDEVARIVAFVTAAFAIGLAATAAIGLLVAADELAMLSVAPFVLQLIGGGMLAALLQLDLSLVYFLENLPRAVPVSNLFIGLGKGFVFGFVIAVVACHFGLHVKPNTESLSANMTSAVVTAITTVILVDAIFAVFTRHIGVPQL